MYQGREPQKKQYLHDFLKNYIMSQIYIEQQLIINWKQSPRETAQILQRVKTLIKSKFLPSVSRTVSVSADSLFIIPQPFLEDARTTPQAEGRARLQNFNI